jgi:kinesin family protein C1
VKEQRGMIPRAVEQIFISAEALKEKGWEYEMEAMFIEIYNEQLRDLLCTKPKEDVKYEIKHDQKGNTTVTNMTSGINCTLRNSTNSFTVKVRNPTQVYELLRRSASHRVVAKTNMNHHSSRSHRYFNSIIIGVYANN